MLLPIMIISACFSTHTVSLHIISKSSFIPNIKRVIGGISLTSYFLLSPTIGPSVPYHNPIRALAIDGSSLDTSSIENIFRVKSSLKYIEEDIQNGKDGLSVVSSVKTLLNNYRLKDNISKSINFVTSSKREMAITAGKAALEDLTSIYEYFSDEPDSNTGVRSIPRDFFQFSLQAVAAASEDLNRLTSSYPDDIIRDIKTKIEEEFKSN